MNKGLKILTLSALCITALTGCTSNDASIDYQLNQLESTIEKSEIANNNSDFFLNEFASENDYDFYNQSTNVSNTKSLFTKNIDTYKNSTEIPVSARLLNIDNSIARRNASHGSESRRYASKYADFRDDSVKYSKINNLEQMYDIAYDISIAKSKYEQIKDDVLIQIDETREMINENNMEEYDDAMVAEYASLIQNNIEKLNNLNSSYNSIYIMDETLTSDFLSARYYNILHCVEDKIDVMEDISEALIVITNNIGTANQTSYNYLLENQSINNESNGSEMLDNNEILTDNDNESVNNNRENAIRRSGLRNNNDNINHRNRRNIRMEDRVDDESNNELVANQNASEIDDAIEPTVRTGRNNRIRRNENNILGNADIINSEVSTDSAMPINRRGQSNINNIDEMSAIDNIDQNYTAVDGADRLTRRGKNNGRINNRIDNGQINDINRVDSNRELDENIIDDSAKINTTKNIDTFGMENNLLSSNIDTFNTNILNNVEENCDICDTANDDTVLEHNAATMDIQPTTDTNTNKIINTHNHNNKKVRI